MASTATVNEGGYDPTIFRDPPRHGELCPICTNVVRHPLRTKECHHVYCKVCLEKWMITCRLNGRAVTCPSDNLPIDERAIFQDAKMKRDINNLPVHCRNRLTGCVVKPLLGDIDDHLKKCCYATVNCPVSCGKRMPRWEVEGHTREKCPRRLVVCPECREELQRQDLVKTHGDVCAMKEIKCDLCAMTVIRKELTNHKETTCPEDMTYCRFAKFGCDTPMKRRKMDDHHRDNKHLNLMLAALSRAQGSVSVALPRGESEGVTGNASMLARQTDKTGLELSVGLRRSLYGGGSGRSVGEGDSGVLGNETLGTVIDTLHTLTLSHKQLTKTVNKLVEEIAGDRLNKMTNEKIKLAKENHQLRSDVAQLTESVDNLSKYAYPVTNTLQLKHPNTIGHIVECPVFYIEDGGYAVQIRSECTNTGTHYSEYEIKCYLMKGLHDDELDWPWHDREGMEIRRHNSETIDTFTDNYTVLGSSRPAADMNNSPLFLTTKRCNVEMYIIDVIIKPK